MSAPSTVHRPERSPLDGKRSRTACKAFSCSNLTRFIPTFPGDRGKLRRLYFKHRLAVLNAISKIDSSPPKSLLRYCNKEKVRVLNNMEHNATAARKVALAIGRQMFGPSKVDCWNPKYISYKEQAGSKRATRYRRQVNAFTRANLALMINFSNASSRYCRFAQLKQWETNVLKSDETARFKHFWKDPFFTPAVLYNSRIKKPTNIDKLRWIEYKDPHMIERRGGTDWSKEEFEDMLKLMWDLKCSESPAMCPL